MGAIEYYVYIEDGQLYLRTESDGPMVLRKGLESHDEPVTLEYLKSHLPNQYIKALKLVDK